MSLRGFFGRDQRGNVAMIFALALVPLSLMTGYGVDIWRQNEARTMAQNAIDAAALAAAAGQGNTQAELQAQVDAFVAANLPVRLRDNPYTVAVDYVDNQLVKVALSSDLPAMFSGIIGRPTLPVAAEATASRGTDDFIEIALVLDNTWSMSGTDASGTTKINGLKTAATALVNEVMASESDRVKVSVVPYADYVNVGAGNRSQPWLLVAPDYSNTTPQTCTTYTTRSTCTGGVLGTCTQNVDGIPVSYSCWTTPQTCTTETVAPYQSCYGPYTTNYTFYGCVVSRNISDLRLNDARPAVPYRGLVQASQTCLNPILQLTQTKSTVQSAIDNLVVNIGGYRPETYIPGGMVWGINVLSPDAPFTDGRAYGRKVRKIIVLMTDGENTLRYNAVDGSHPAPSASTRTADLARTDSDTSDLCRYAKGQRMEIYTVGLGVSSSTARALMRDCASGADHAYNADDAAGLLESFAAIARSINAVRLVD